MSIKKTVCVTTATAAVGLTGTVGVVAAASAPSGPTTSAAAATLTTHPVAGTTHVRHCKGADGDPYLHVRETDRGPIMSDDPRIRGTLQVRIRNLLVDLKTGVGAATGTVSIRNARTGDRKAHGTLVESLAGNMLRGLVKLHFASGGRLIANVSGNVDFTTDTVTAAFGADSPVPDLATVTEGKC
jgi:hypothetical protein